MITRLSGKTAVVTGGGGGLGSAIVTALAAERAHVLVVDRYADAAERAARNILVTGILGPTGGRANGLAPGRIKSGLMTITGEGNAKYLERVPLGRVGEIDEIAGPAVFLASDMSSYVTGITIPVDGGYLYASE